jgi:oligoribonuclease
MARIERKQSARNLVWIDLEMTGLNPEQDVILQVALALTNENLEVLEEYTADVYQAPAQLEVMGPFVRKMHTKTGLLARLAQGAELRHVEQELLERISGWCPYRAVLCGNTIHSDRKFIDRYMPGLSAYLHYRMVDVSSLKILSQLWMPSHAQFQKSMDGEHDALFDIRQSILELSHYRKVFLHPDVQPA